MRRAARLAPALGLILAFVTLTGFAHADEWRHTIAPYVWGPSVDIESSVGGDNSGDSDADFGDILENVEFAGMLRYEAQSPRWGVMFDTVYVGMGFPSETTPAEVDIDATVVELAGSWHATDRWELILGARYWDVSADIDYDILPDTEGSKSWLDGIVGFRANVPVCDAWKWYFRGDVGAGGSDLTWNAETAFLWNPNDVFSLALGWRVLTTDYDSGSGADEFEMDATVNGPFVGAAFHF